jgi:hypothetical protein
MLASVPAFQIDPGRTDAQRVHALVAVAAHHAGAPGKLGNATTDRQI